MRVHGGRLEVEAHAERAALLGRSLRQGGQDGGPGGEAGGGQRGEAQETAPGHVSRIHVRRDARHAVSSPDSHLKGREACCGRDGGGAPSRGSPKYERPVPALSSLTQATVRSSRGSGRAAGRRAELERYGIASSAAAEDRTRLSGA